MLFTVLSSPGSYSESSAAPLLHLCVLEVNPPRWLNVTLKLSILWRALGKCAKVVFASQMKEVKHSRSEKMVERDPHLLLALGGQLKLPQ
jgi:hypothetical protein